MEKLIAARAMKAPTTNTTRNTDADNQALVAGGVQLLAEHRKRCFTSVLSGGWFGSLPEWQADYCRCWPRVQLQGADAG